MPRPGARDKLADFDPNKSDSNDSDFAIDASSPRPRRPTHKRKKPSSASHRTPQKKRARRGSDSDIVDDDEEISHEEFTESSEEEVVERNEKGRAVRSAAKKVPTYEESDAEEEPFVEETGDESEDNESDELNISPKKTRTTTKRGDFKENLLRPSRIVRLHFTKWGGLSSSSRPSPAAEEVKEVKMTRARSVRSRTTSRPPTAMATATRKSSRLSREPEPLQALSSSGRHAIPASSPDDDDDFPSRRRAVGSKGPRPAAAKQPPRKMPSMVMEQSQEGTQQDDEDEAGEEAAEKPAHDVVDSVEIHVEEAEEVEDAEVAEPEPILETDTPAPAEEGEAEVPVIEEPQVHGTDDSDGPVGRRRTLRVCLFISRHDEHFANGD